jgi:hypothetical protein
MSVRTQGARKRVNAPSPGPISSMTSSPRGLIEAAILRAMLSSLRKFWPSDRFGRTRDLFGVPTRVLLLLLEEVF